jgi:hypothetical protein
MTDLDLFTAHWVQHQMYPGRDPDPTITSALDAWNKVMGGAAVPPLVQYVDDAATGRYVLPCSREFEAYLDSFDRTLNNWTQAARACQEMLTNPYPATCLIVGQALLRVRARDQKATPMPIPVHAVGDPVPTPKKVRAKS